jgi:CARDB protein/putative Ig domain-containing protein
MRRSVFFAVAMAIALSLAGSAQQVGPNVNVLSGIDPYTGDAYLQRQNEPAVAISSRNADHLMLAFNDYRTVDIASDTSEPDAAVFAKAERKPKSKGIITAESVRAASPPEAWIGLAFSRDRGRTFYNALLPGYPQDTSAVGKASPVYGDNAGSDPVLIAGQNGRVYLIALTFDRGGVSRITSTRFVDKNYVEGGEPFYFDGTKQIDRGSVSSKGRFADKPAAAVYTGVSSQSTSASSPGQAKKQTSGSQSCERVHTAYTVFEGNESNGNFRSSILTSRSTNCGDTWSAPIKVNAPFSSNGVNNPGTRNQGAAMAIDPDNGDVYIAWRTYGPDGMVYVKSVDGGQTYSKPRPIVAGPMFPYDQPLLKSTDGFNVVTFRSNGYPALTVVGGHPVATWSERLNLVSGLFEAAGVPRAVLTVGTKNPDGSIGWSPRRPVDLQDSGASQLNKRCEQLVNPIDPAVPLVDCSRDTGAQVMPYVAAQNGQVAVVYYEARSDDQAPGGLALVAPGIRYISGMERQVDVRGALINPATWVTTTSFQISRYQIDPATGKVKLNPNAPPALAPRVNYANYPMYLGGIAPFIGDYIHAIPMGSGAGFRVAFTSNEFVEPPASLNFMQYDKPQPGNPPTCNPGSRNSTIMTAEIGTDLVVGSPGTFKQLGGVQRAFAVYVENHTPGFRAFRLTLAAGTDVAASFEQTGLPVTSVDVEILGSSSVTRTVFLSGNVATGSAVVNVAEIPLYRPGTTDLLGAVPRGLTASLTLNGDPTNPFVGSVGGNPGLRTTETHTPQLGTPQLGTPQLGTPQLGTPQLGTPQLGTPQLGTPQVSAPQLGTNGLPDPTVAIDPLITDVTYRVSNAGNTASGFNALVSLANSPELQQSGHTFQVIAYRVHQTASASGCGLGKAQQDQVVYMTPQLGTPQLGTPQLGTSEIGAPQLGTPQLGTPQLGTPQLGTPQLGTTQLASASFTIAPADPTPFDHDGTVHELQADDFMMLDLRIRHLHAVDPIVLATENAQILAGYALGVQAQASNTGDNDGIPDGTFYGPDLQIAGSLAVPASPVVPGDTVTLSPFAVKNFGNTASNSPTGSVSTHYYLSTDAVITAADMDLGSAPAILNSQLGPGQQVAFGPVSIVVPNVAPGTYYIGVLTDSADKVAESLENNNYAAVPLIINAPLTIVTGFGFFEGAAPLTGGVFDSAYSTPVVGAGGVGAYTWTLTAGALPVGLGLVSGTPSATIAGTPGKVGTGFFTLKLADSAGHERTRTFRITIALPANPMLRFVTSPASSYAGKRLGLTATPEVQAYYVRPDTTEIGIPGVVVSIGLGTNPTGASIAGPDTALFTGPGGTAKLPNVWIDKTGGATPGSAAVGSYTLKAIAAGLSDGTSGIFNVMAKRILIYPDSFVENLPDGAGETPNERTIAVAQGYTVVIPTSSDWSSYTAVDFAKYNAIVIPDPNHHHNPTGTVAVGWTRAENTRVAWSAAVTGPKAVVGSDPIFHQALSGADTLMRNGINFAASGGPDTGLFAELSTAYFGLVSVPVTLLDQFGTFRATGLESSSVHIVLPTHAMMADLSDATLSAWGSSVHAWFDQYPGTWQVAAVENSTATLRAYILVDR